MRTKSIEIYEKGCALIPGGVNSPVRSFKNVGMAPPLIVESGSGATIRDADGNEYIDYCMGWGSLILGHAHPKIVDAATRQMELGSSFGIATNLEVKMAEKLGKIVEKSRLVSSGTEATMTAARLARGYTGKSKIIKFSGHYHGHADPFLVQGPSGKTSKGINQGVMDDTLCFPFNDFEAIRSFFRKDPRAKEVAAIILEPVAGNMGVVLPQWGFLEMLREESAQADALLIFDEVITGYRVGLKGVQGVYGIQPDLSCFGKIIGGGFPLAAVGGKKEIMDFLAPIGEVYQAGTLSGNPVAVAAGLTAIHEVEKEGFYEGLQRKTDLLTAPIRKAIQGKGSLVQCGSMFSIFFDEPKIFNHFFQTLFHQGIYIPPSPFEAWFLSSAHTEDQIEFTVDQITHFLQTV